MLLLYTYNHFFNLTSKHQSIMFNLFKKNPLKKLEQQYERLMEEAMQLQRGGDIQGYARKMAEAEEVQKEMEALSNKG